MRNHSVPILLLLAVLMEAGYVALNRLHNLKQFVVEYIAISMAISVFYLVSCWWITKKKAGAAGALRAASTRRQMACILLAGLAFRITLLPLYPSLTEDPHRYRWNGKLQAAGGNPYRERPAEARWAGLRDRTWGQVNSKDLTTAYGPVLEWSYRLTYAVVSRVTPDEFRQTQLFKIPYLIFDLGAAVALALLLSSLGLPRAWILIYFWSPLVIVEYWASGHNDPVAVFFVVLALWAGCTGRWGWAFGALWMAALSKFWPALLFPLFLWSGGRQHFLGRVGKAAAWTPLAVVLSLPYWTGATDLARTLAGFAGGWRDNASLYNWIYAAAGADYERGKPIVTALMAAVSLMVAWRRPPLPQGALWIMAAVLFLSANCFPWYVTWLVPLLAVNLNVALLLWTALVPLAYHILIGYQALGRWQDDPFYLYLEYVPVYGLLIAAWLLERRFPGLYYTHSDGR